MSATHIERVFEQVEFLDAEEAIGELSKAMDEARYGWTGATISPCVILSEVNASPAWSATDEVINWLDDEELLIKCRRALAKGAPLSAWAADILYKGKGPGRTTAAYACREGVEKAGGFDSVDWLTVRATLRLTL